MERIEKEKRVAPCIRKMNHLIARNMEARVKAEGIDEITLMHGWIIRYLYSNQGKDIYQKDIEKHFCVGRSTVTNIIQAMEKKGYLRRESVEQDARLKKLILSEKGISLHQGMEHLVDELNAKTIKGITNEELDVFFRVMDKLEANIMQQRKEENDA